jgi:hypothetical protein
MSNPEAGWYQAPDVVPRDLAPNPRCPACKTGTMFHPAHPRSPCTVTNFGEEPCGCTAQEHRTGNP